MNVTMIIGFILANLVFFGTIAVSIQDNSAVFNYQAAIVVFGGTLAATLMGMPSNQIFSTIRAFLRNLLNSSGKDSSHFTIKEIVKLSKAYRKGNAAFVNQMEQLEEPFLKDAIQVFHKVKNEVTAPQLKKILLTRTKTYQEEYMSVAKNFRLIAKFPPAFGLMGTTIGLIAVLQSIGLSSDSKDMIGPSMAIALVTTLYGLALANFVLGPFAENVIKNCELEVSEKKMVVEGIMLIFEETPTVLIEEQLKSYLTMKNRRDYEEKSMVAA